MDIITLPEIIDLVVMILAVGFIFKDSFRLPVHDYDPLKYRNLNFQYFKMAVMVTTPAVVFHEMAHKFVALSMGIPAVFHASYSGLAIGVILKVVNSPFVFFIPGFVSHSYVSHLSNALIAISGPLMNLALWLFSEFMLRTNKRLKNAALFHVSKQINMFLFIFNMIPFPGTDGFHFFMSLIRIVGG